MTQTTDKESIGENATATRQTFLLFCPGHEFVVPYLERLLGEKWTVVTRLQDCDDPDRAVMLSSTDIYDVESGLNYDEETPVYPESSWNADERMFEGYCRQRDLTPTIIRCANTVGTGMKGLPMDLARGIFRGTLRHIAVPRVKHETRLRKNTEVAQRPEALLSVIHATDVAVAAELLSRPGRQPEQSEIFNLSDNTQTDINDLIDALAHRINDKHVGSASPFWARMLNGRRIWRAMNRSLTFNPMKILRVTGIEPHPVTEYLRTHVYDESSL